VPYVCLICVLICIGLLAARESLQMACGVGGSKHDPRQNPGSPYVCLICDLICALYVPYMCLICAFYVPYVCLMCGLYVPVYALCVRLVRAYA
jgi:hypothetical protein